MEKSRRILIFIAAQFDEREFIYPYYRLQEAGYQVVVAAPKAGTYKGKTTFEWEAEAAFGDVQEADFAALVIPGGFAPDKIRVEKAALRLVQDFKKAGKPIAMICHAGWVAASADVVRGVKLTSTKAIKDDMVNAGAHWEDREVIVDKGFITSRSPDDLPAFTKALLKELGA